MYRTLKYAPVLFFDLDTLIVGDISGLARTTHGFTMVDDFVYAPAGNSCVQSWLGDYSHLTDTFAKDAYRLGQKWDSASNGQIGDQGFIHQELGSVDKFDKKAVVRYKPTSRHPPKDARVIAFCGLPKQNASGWPKKVWDAL